MRSIGRRPSQICQEKHGSGEKRAGARYRLSASAAVSITLILAAPAQSYAANLEWTGATSGDWFTGGNWSGGTAPTASDSVTITTTNLPSAVISAPGAVSSGAVIGGFSVITGGPGSGNVTVTGAASTWATQQLLVGGNTSTVSTLRIENGGRVDSTFGEIGGGGRGQAIVTGAGSTWDVSIALFVGGATQGTLQIENGATVLSGGSRIGSINGRGDVAVTSANSVWSTSGDVYVGGDAATGGPQVGTLTIGNGGKVSAATLFIATQADSTGTLTIGVIGTAPVAPGVLDTSTVAFGNGTGDIVFNHAASDYVFVPKISGHGSINVLAGTTILTAENLYTGDTNIYGGTLAVNGSIASSPLTTVNAGGTLSGTGTVGNTTINGGTLAPGNSIGTLTVQGSLVFTAAASYLVEVSPANADRTTVTGTATLGGATVSASFAPGAYVTKRYTILNAAGGVTGSFAGPVNTNLPQNFTSSLSYDPNNVYLDLTLNYVPPPSAPDFGNGLNRNQQQVANALVNSFNATGSIPLAFGALTPQGLTQVSGELATGTQQATFNAMGLFLGLLTDPIGADRGDRGNASMASPYADDSSTYAAGNRRRSAAEREAYAAVSRKAPQTFDPLTSPWSVWAAGFGGSQTTDGKADVGSNRGNSSAYGAAVGANYRLSPDTLLGFAMAGGGTNFSVANGGSGRSDLFQAGAFVRHSIGAAYLTGALAYGWQDVTTERTVTAGGIEQLRARFNANAVSGRIEAGYRTATPWLGITPYAAGQFTSYFLPAYVEQTLAGAGLFGLSYAAKDVTASRAELGLRAETSLALQDTIVTLRGRAAWAHNFDTDRAIAATFQALPGASFVVNGAAQAADAALVTAAAETRWTSGLSLAATFEGEFSGITTSYAGKGAIRYAW